LRKGVPARSALDQDILNLPSMDVSSSGDESDDGDGDASVRFRSDGESEQPSTDDNEPDEYALRPEDLGPARLKLGGKRKRFLGAMMPGAFIKKAEADLKLMAQEVQLSDYSDGSEINSGDEEALRRAHQRNLAKKRKAPGLLDDPIRFDGDAFTDESGTNSDRTDDGLGAAQEEEEEAENDAVASWLHSFAPQRAQGGANEDIVDRFLKRAKRPPKSNKPKRSTKTSGAHADRRGDKESSHRKRKRSKGSRPPEGITVVPSNGRATGAGAPKRRTRAIPLDTDEAIFSCAGLRHDAPDSGPDDGPAAMPAAARAHVAEPTNNAGVRLADIPPVQAESGAGEVWSSFGKFSYDFDFKRLPSGLRIERSGSFVSNGHLLSLVRKDETASNSGSCDVFGITLAAEDDAETLVAMLPTVVDGVYAALRAIAYDEAEDDSETGPQRALQFVGRWLDSCQSTIDVARVAKALAFHLDRLDTRLKDVHDSPTTSRRYRLACLELAWYQLDLTIRSHRQDTGPVLDRLRAEVTHLIRLLIRYGLERTVKTLKAASLAQATITDTSVEIWLGLVSLATNVGPWADAGLSTDGLWRAVLEETEASLSEQARRGPVRGEVLSYTAVLLSAVSQFTPAGMSVSVPRLPAHWPVVLKTLDGLSASALAKSDSSLSSTAISRRDRYLWTLFARCLNFIERWNWNIDIRDDLLNRLFELLSARRLSDLSTETAGDFPAFLQDIAEFGHAPLDPKQDTAFAIFLKIVIAACDKIPATSDAERRKRGAQLTRLFLRLTPMVSSSWNRHSPELARGSSVLTNHLSLHLAFAVIHPPAAAQRLDHARRLVVFADTDEEARRTCIRAALYFGLAFRHCGLAVTPVVTWLAEMVAVLKSEYVDVERARRKALRKEDARPTGQGDPLWQRAVLLTMALRSIQLIMRWKRAGASNPDFPDLALLDPGPFPATLATSKTRQRLTPPSCAAWTSHLLDSPLALDPMIGRETIKTIECFLDVRHAAMAPPPSAALAADADAGNGNGESQDDYGGLDFDFDDPALNALLGVVETPGDPRADLKTKDKATAEVRSPLCSGSDVSPWG
jgi:hypothetical protein